MSNARHSSESSEHYTPPEVIDIARQAMGGIDLDPASCALANTLVGAAEFFDIDDNGLECEWHGRVFLNPPGGKIDANGFRVVKDCTVTGACGLPPMHEHKEPVTSASKTWWFKMAREFIEGRIDSAVFLGFSIEILQTTQVKPPDGLPTAADFACCFPSRRLSFLSPNVEGQLVPKKGNTHASVLVLLGIPEEKHETFWPLGKVLKP